MRRRDPTESIAAVGDDIRQMAQKAYCNLDSLAQEALALNQLYKIVSLEMKCRCIDRDCRTVAEAVDVIERYEAIMGENSDRKKSNMRTIDSFPAERTELKLESTLDRIEARLDKLEKQAQYTTYAGLPQRTAPRQSSGTQRQTKRTCYTCSSPHHLFKNCPYNNPAIFYQHNSIPQQSYSIPQQHPESRNSTFTQQHPEPRNSTFPQQHPEPRNSTFPQQHPEPRNSTFPQQRPEPTNSTFPQQHP
ncbi:MAG: procyclic acidic repetitive family protein, partial [Candidatus Thiodiazotropha taylori]|nr:procyclic acidic repetitive family protein [Candidatus Thiodiazotropha taylori]MCW4285573.1 procyclic acidic repetitive family protein [Candidatus Thiodiazotropha taylori]